jgi:3'-phosphoadenosine 5'-phosphosulfate sulfotransferase (PAPS reductase)/FAD synthetase
MSDNNKVIVSSSFGKDSTAMIHLMLEHGEQIDEVMYFETGWEFPQMENHIKKVEKNTGIKTVRIRHYRHFNELLGRWGWPRKEGGWCVGCKRDGCMKLFRALRGTIECVGYSADERSRTKSIIKRKKWLVWFPLIEYGLSESDALSYYKVFNRVSCFCCPKAGPKRIETLRLDFPDLYQKYLEMDEIVREKREG